MCHRYTVLVTIASKLDKPCHIDFCLSEFVCISNQLIQGGKSTFLHSRKLSKYIQLESFDYILPRRNSKDSGSSKGKKGRRELLTKYTIL